MPETESQAPLLRSVLPGLIGVGACVVLTGVAGMAIPQAWSAPIVRYGGIPAMAILVVWCWVSLWQTGTRRTIAEALRSGREEVWITAGLVIAFSAWVHLREPHGFKMIMDEPIQMVTSAQMHLEHTTGTMLRGLWLENQFVVTNDMIDKRPLLFPFLVSIVHGVVGFRPENGVLFNALLTPLFLGGFYWVLRRLTGRVLAAAGVVLLLSAGIIGQNLTGSGFEMLNVALFLGVGAALCRFAVRRDAWSCSLFLSLVALQVNVRYESAVMVLPAVVAFLVLLVRTPELFRRRSIYLAPLALLPQLLIFRVFEERPELWQLDEIKGATSPFSPAYVFENVGHAIEFLFAGSGRYGNSPVLAALGLIGAIACLVRLPRMVRGLWGDPRPERILLVWALGGLLHAAFVMFYVWARFDDVTATRLAIPLLCSLAFFAVWFLHEIVSSVRSQSLAPVVLAASVAYLVLFYGTAATHGRYLRDNQAAETANWINAVAKRVEPRETLVVDDLYRHVWTLNRISVTLPQVLADRPEQFRFVVEHRVYAEILIVMGLFAVDEDGTMGTSPWFDIGDWATTELVEEKRMSHGFSTQVLRLKAVDWERFEQWRIRVKDTPLRPIFPFEPIQKFRERVLENTL